MEPFVSLVRRWSVDWLSSADPAACEEILAPAYTLLIGGYRLEGREDYIEATLGQLGRFPGLGMTVHEVVASDDRVAVRFTLHGAAPRLEAREAAWGGVALFRWDGRQLTEGFAEEDYFSRRRQLSSGECDPIEPPAAAPWNVAAREADPAPEDVVRHWLQRGDLSTVDRDDSWMGHDATLRLGDVTTELDELFSAGSSVAFHGVQRGRYEGGLEGVEDHAGERVSLHFAGIVTVEGGDVVRGRVVRDRAGLHRALTAQVAT